MTTSLTCAPTAGTSRSAGQTTATPFCDTSQSAGVSRP